MKISFIIPVYKVEKYIDQCIQSIIEQTYSNWEMILIDDGSPDNCPQICDAWMSKDSRIRVVHKQNGGLSSARNTGIREANGEYVIFLDSDDYWDNRNALEIFVNMLRKNKEDILTYRYKKYIEISKEYIHSLVSCDENYINHIETKDERLKILLEKGIYLSAAWNKVVRREFLYRHDLYFKEGVTSEDIDWCARCLLYADNIMYSDLECYVYRQRDCSITHSIGMKNIIDLKENIEECVRLGAKIKKTDEFYKIYHTFVAYQYGVFLCTNTLVKDERIKDIVEEMEKYQWLLQYRSNKKIKMLYYVNKILGYNNLIRCMSIYAKMRKG